ncbi:MAG: membrane-bound lytic murein transglycosylase MltF [Rhodocyclaceae bacterium]|nr:membrane-bound lytic murein transglycosylase MltF [Rhodocyclaceae bacterium]
MRTHSFFLFAAALLLSACGERTPPPIGESRELVVLTREGPTILTRDENGGRAGFEYDLVALFAEELGKKLRLVVVRHDAEVISRLRDGRGHLGAAWLTAADAPALPAGPSFFTSANVVVQNENALTADKPEKLAGRALHVLAGSRQVAAARELQGRIDDLRIVEHPGRDEFALLEMVAQQRDATALVDRAALDIAANFYPQLQHELDLNGDIPVVWLFAAGAEPTLIERARAFVERIRADGTLARLADRYFGHVDRLDQIDAMRFIERVRTLLPRYRTDFQTAQVATGIDWRLLAALAYQESHWDPLATSPTGVRGMMMLTADTADQLRVSNRLDAKQSIRAGARYLADLRDMLPATVAEPDRTWLAVAAYNLGMGHMNGARYIAQTLKRDPDSWYEMKRVLPLLARPQYYQRLKSGRGRGGEAVIMTENIRVFYDILSRFEPVYRPFADDGIAAAHDAAPGTAR